MSFISAQYVSNDRPGFFEVVAQDRMMYGLKMASKYVVEVKSIFPVFTSRCFPSDIFLLVQCIDGMMRYFQFFKWW